MGKKENILHWCHTKGYFLSTYNVVFLGRKTAAKMAGGNKDRPYLHLFAPSWTSDRDMSVIEIVGLAINDGFDELDTVGTAGHDSIYL